MIDDDDDDDDDGKRGYDGITRVCSVVYLVGNCKRWRTMVFWCSKLLMSFCM